MSREVISTPEAPEYPSYSQAVKVGNPDVRPPRCVSKLGVDRPGILVSIAMVAVTD